VSRLVAGSKSAIPGFRQRPPALWNGHPTGNVSRGAGSGFEKQVSFRWIGRGETGCRRWAWAKAHRDGKAALDRDDRLKLSDNPPKGGKGLEAAIELGTSLG